MSGENSAEQKINAAAAGSAKVQQAWHLAYRTLSGGASTNGLGIYMDQFAVRNSLLDARAHIDEALAKLTEIDWPTNADYDAAG